VGNRSCISPPRWRASGTTSCMPVNTSASSAITPA
jgi:hypothetical protein